MRQTVDAQGRQSLALDILGHDHQPSTISNSFSAILASSMIALSLGGAHRLRLGNERHGVTVRKALGETPNCLRKQVAKYWLDENPHSSATWVTDRSEGFNRRAVFIT